MESITLRIQQYFQYPYVSGGTLYFLGYDRSLVVLPLAVGWLCPFGWPVLFDGRFVSPYVGGMYRCDVWFVVRVPLLEVSYKPELGVKEGFFYRCPPPNVENELRGNTGKKSDILLFSDVFFLLYLATASLLFLICEWFFFTGCFEIVFSSLFSLVSCTVYLPLLTWLACDHRRKSCLTFWL